MDDKEYAEDPYFKEKAGDVDADEDDIPLILDREEEVTMTSVPASTPGHLPSPPTTYLATTDMVPLDDPPQMKIPVSEATVNSPPIVWIAGAAIIAQVNYYCGKIFRDTIY